MSGELVTFGKYKGQPIETVAADVDYANWLMAQVWFRERFVKFYSLLSAIQTPTETPEHNAMQVKFLDNNYCLAFLKAINNEIFNTQLDQLIKTIDQGVKIEIFREFEYEGSDVALNFFEVGANYPSISCKIELKPLLGDDYPAVLREAKLAKCRVVLIDEFSSNGATFEQVKAIFKASHIYLMKESKIEIYNL